MPGVMCSGSAGRHSVTSARDSTCINIAKKISDLGFRISDFVFVERDVVSRCNVRERFSTYGKQNPKFEIPNPKSFWLLLLLYWEALLLPLFKTTE
jgi:hypothetical protein